MQIRSLMGSYGQTLGLDQEKNKQQMLLCKNMGSFIEYTIKKQKKRSCMVYFYIKGNIPLRVSHFLVGRAAAAAGALGAATQECMKREKRIRNLSIFIYIDWSCMLYVRTNKKQSQITYTMQNIYTYILERKRKVKGDVLQWKKEH